MDDRLKQALEFSNYRITLNNQLYLLKEQFDIDCLFYKNGGTFKLTQEFIHYVSNMDGDIILLTTTNMPVKIKKEELEVFKKEINEKYNTAISKYYDSYERIKKQRTVENLTND